MTREDAIKTIQKEFRKLEKTNSKLKQEVKNKKTQERYAGALEMLNQQLEEGEPLFAEHPSVQQATEIGDRTPEEVLDDMKTNNPDFAERTVLQSDSDR